VHVLQANNMALGVVVEWTVTCHITAKLRITARQTSDIGPISWSAAWIHTKIPICFVKLAGYTFECFNCKGEDVSSFSQMQKLQASIVCMKSKFVNISISFWFPFPGKQKKIDTNGAKVNMKHPHVNNIAEQSQHLNLMRQMKSVVQHFGAAEL